MAKTFEEWAGTEVHDPKKKISNFEKLSAPFIINKYSTWGDVYEAAGIEPPKEKPKTKPKDKSVGNAEDINNLIEFQESLLSLKESGILRYEKGSDAYIAADKDLETIRARIKKLRQSLQTSRRTEASTEREDKYQAALSAWEAKEKAAKKQLEVAEDTGGNVAAAKIRLDNINNEKPKAPVVAKTPDQPESGYYSGTTFIPGPKPEGTPATPSTPTTGTPATGSTPSQTGTPPKGTGKPKAGTPPKKGKTPTPAKKVLTIDEIIDAVANEYGSIDTIFKTDPGLQALLRKAIGKDNVPNTDDDLTVDQFVNELENTDWFKTNANAVRQRGFYKRQFDDLVASGSDPEELYRTTEYGRGLKNTQQIIADEIVRVGGNLSPEDIELLSRDIYDLGYESQKAIVSQRIRAKISYKPGGIVSGEAGENLADLRKTAKANGLDLEKNFGDSIQGWLQKLAQGESVETFKQIIRGSAKIGLPEKVSALLDQGVDLDTVYNPYKRLMASVLEINPETISLDDSVLRSAIGPDKEMSLYDYQKMLRKDNRWQYTDQAKQEVSQTALKVLRDFGFQG
jgi:exonuclease VII small subunit